ncbi:MAG: HEPN domain-containing protein [Desulfobacterales bacterium]|nr:HEPN domain-containing protein [Desulfobacterales bacterium]
MPERSKDWLDQAIRDLEKAKLDVKWKYFEWACFTAQQAAEKAVKALFQYIHADAWGHSVSGLLKALPNEIAVSESMVEIAIMLDRYYIPTRYPNGFDSGMPKDYFTKKDGDDAVKSAGKIIEFCKSKIS